MEHLAIMRKSWGLTQKILTGKKKIESRWYSTKYPPFDKIKKGDVVYFKDSGEPVTIKAEVSDAKQFSDLTPDKVKNILNEYGELDGIEKHEIGNYFEMFKDKKYCILVFLKNPVSVKPFKVSKKGYGMMSSWICLEKIGVITEA
ncbi:MAG: hypothetical protein HYU56_01970 [Candidatus Aenigmarchaeota archaeon]|nr:hypothetical protein [Candidatus Aenigmarchaeota archaeon]